MNWNAFTDLPDDSRVWIHGFQASLGTDQQELVRRGLQAFLPQWVSHGEPVRGAFDLVADRFVVTAGHCQGGLSGCSIDSLVRNFKQLRDLHGLDALQGGLIYFRSPAGKVASADQRSFRALLEAGTVTPDTPVFQTSAGTLGTLRREGFETPLRDSWLARVLPIPA